jgi:hypothetical protein
MAHDTTNAICEGVSSLITRRHIFQLPLKIFIPAVLLHTVGHVLGVFVVILVQLLVSGIDTVEYLLSAILIIIAENSFPTSRNNSCCSK